MKFVAVLIFVTLVPAFQGAGMAGYIKVLKMVVKLTGKTRCKGLFVKLKPVTRYETTIDAGCEELTRPIVGGFVNVKVFTKTANMQNFRHIITLNNLEPCVITADRTKFPALNYFFDRAKEVSPEYVHLCPYTEVKLYNMTLKFMQNPSAKDREFFNAFNFHLPNGVYKVHGEAWDPDVGDGANVTIWFEANYRKRITHVLNDM